MKNTEGVPRGRGLAAPESEYPMVLLCVSVCKHSNYRITIWSPQPLPLKDATFTPHEPYCRPLNTAPALDHLSSPEDKPSATGSSAQSVDLSKRTSCQT